MKNKKYKLVKVSYSYSEYDILDVELVEGESKKEVIKEQWKSKHIYHPKSFQMLCADINSIKDNKHDKEQTRIEYQGLIFFVC